MHASSAYETQDNSSYVESINVRFKGLIFSLLYGAQMCKWDRKLLCGLIMWKNAVDNCCVNTRDLGFRDLNHFLSPFVSIIAKHRLCANFNTWRRSIRPLKWLRWSYGFDFPSNESMVGGRRSQGRGASWIFSRWRQGLIRNEIYLEHLELVTTLLWSYLLEVIGRVFH